MKLEVFDFNDLYFPRGEWQWLRHPLRYEAESPDSFVWGVKLSTGRIVAWNRNGSDFENGFTGMKVRTLLLEPALPLKDSNEELVAFGLYLKTSFEYSSPIDVEWTAALSVLERHFNYSVSRNGFPPYWKEALKAAGLEPHLGVLASRNRYLFLNHKERQTLFDKRWELASFELLETLLPALREALLDCLLQWNLSSGQAKEAVNLVGILERKFGEKSALKILKSNFKSAEEFRTTLMRTAQPELAFLSQSRIDQLRSLQLPPRTSVFGDPSFEKDGIKITHSPRSISDFQEFKEWVENPEILQKIKALLEIYQ